jgi:hypothetical protein
MVTFVSNSDGSRSLLIYGKSYKEDKPPSLYEGVVDYFVNGQILRVCHMWDNEQKFQWISLKNGKLHCVVGPAEWTSTSETWYINGKRHRSDGPADVYTAANKLHINYYYNNKLHKDNGPAVMYGDRIEYWHHGKRHRTDGPAIDIANFDSKSSGSIQYIVNGKLHKLDGPAYKSFTPTEDGQIIEVDYYIHNKKLSPSQFYQQRRIFRLYLKKLQTQKRRKIKQQLYTDSSLPLVLCDEISQFVV